MSIKKFNETEIQINEISLCFARIASRFCYISIAVAPYNSVRFSCQSIIVKYENLKKTIFYCIVGKTLFKIQKSFPIKVKKKFNFWFLIHLFRFS